jgi:Carboxypeptidase regulatory-like domain
MRTSALAALLLPALLAGCLGDEVGVAAPTGQIDGAVVDQVLRPFANQTVYLSQLGWTDQTSPLGGFSFRQVPVGSYTLLAAHDGTQGTAVVVTVEADRVTKVILQLLPTPVNEPHMAIFPSHTASENVTEWSAECKSCAQTVALNAPERPAEVVIQFQWESSLLGENGNDVMDFEVRDDLGNLVRSHRAMTSPTTVTLDGADILPDAEELRILAKFGPAFTPRANFRLDSYVTVYYGATSSEIFSA